MPVPATSTAGTVDPWSGYRHYTADQLPDLNLILALNDLGFTLAENRQDDGRASAQ